MVGIFEIISNPWLAIALACATIAYGLYVILFTKQKPKSESQKEEFPRSDSEMFRSIDRNLNSIVTLLNQIDRRLESVDSRLGQTDIRISQAEDSDHSRGNKIIPISRKLGQSGWR